MIFLKSIELKNKNKFPDNYPFNLSLIREFKKLDFTSSVTFFVGENGSGKSTLLESIAAGVGSITIGGENIERDKTLQEAVSLSKHFQFSWSMKTHKGFFLRAEDFFNFAKRMQQLAKEMEDDAKDYEKKFSGYGLMLAKGVANSQRAGIVEKYGENLNANSHGESFLKIFKSRFAPKGLYLLDEPEVPLSPQRQLSLLAMIKEMIADGESQFIIATHSPILMAFPEAEIYNFDEIPIKRVDYDDLDHVNLTRNFLNNPEQYLRFL